MYAFDCTYQCIFFRDDPSEMPVFVASNCAKENGNLIPVGDNLFAAVQ